MLKIVEKRLRISQNNMRTEKTSWNKPIPTENLKKNHTGEVCLCLVEIWNRQPILLRNNRRKSTLEARASLDFSQIQWKFAT